jgi:hypothetical protein
MPPVQVYLQKSINDTDSCCTWSPTVLCDINGRITNLFVATYYFCSAGPLADLAGLAEIFRIIRRILYPDRTERFRLHW